MGLQGSSRKLWIGIGALAVLAALYELMIHDKKPSVAQPVSAAADGGLSLSSDSHQEVKVSPVAPQASTLPVSITQRDRELDQMLSQILASKNDNDPRLDTEFKNLSPGTKYLLEQKYQSLPTEARNERGTVVFLIGRDLAKTGTSADFKFLNQVAAEPPCLSLSDCSHETKAGPEDSHEETAIGVTLAYPQHVLLHTLQDFLKNQSGESPLAPSALHTLETLSHSAVPSVAAQAQALLAQFRKH
jgi:hypothetical protein